MSKKIICFFDELLEVLICFVECIEKEKIKDIITN